MTDNMLVSIYKADPRPRQTLRQALEQDDCLIATLYLAIKQDQDGQDIADEIQRNLSPLHITVSPSNGAPINKSITGGIVVGLAILNGSVNAFDNPKKIKRVIEQVAERKRATLTPGPRAFPELIKEYLNEEFGLNNWLYDANQCFIKKLGKAGQFTLRRKDPALSTTSSLMACEFEKS